MLTYHEVATEGSSNAACSFPGQSNREAATATLQIIYKQLFPDPVHSRTVMVYVTLEKNCKRSRSVASQSGPLHR